MRITVSVHPRSSRTEVVKRQDGSIAVYVIQPPVEGKANEALRETLSDYYGVAKSRIRVLRGTRSRLKLVEII